MPDGTPAFPTAVCPVDLPSRWWRGQKPDVKGIHHDDLRVRFSLSIFDELVKSRINTFWNGKGKISTGRAPDPRGPRRASGTPQGRGKKGNAA